MRKYTVKPDPIDKRDYVFKTFRTVSLPLSVDLRYNASPVVDQGSLGSCTANAIASGLREFIQIRDKGINSLVRLSRLYLYWHERNLMGTVNEDSGAYIRDGFKVLQQRGCSAELFHNDDMDFRTRPSENAEISASFYKIAEYHRVMNYNDLKEALAAGLPVVLGIEVYSSFESYTTSQTGIVSVPKPSETFLGGHAVLAMGYRSFSDDEYIIVRNSWGENWGINGYCYIPKTYFDAGHVIDMWTGDVAKAVKPEDLSFAQSIDIAVKHGIFDSPEFWANFEAKYKAGQLTNADFEYVFLGFRKWAADKENRGL